jgi:Domain of unknown function (DUF4760)
MEIATTIATLALIVSIATFYLTFTRGRKSEQIKMTHDILREFSEAENRLLDVEYDKDPHQWQLRHLQYLNTLEWFSFLVNHGELKDEDLKEYFKPLLIRDHDTVLGHDGLETQKNNPEDFKEFKKLYKKWST